MVWMRSAQTQQIRTASTILLVDDNQDGVLARRAVLEELGYKVVAACSGPEALGCFDEQSFDLVITDFKMTPMNGVEFIKALRGRRVATPVILLTGFAESVGLKPESTGADVVIQKSANEIATLVRQTNRLLNPRKPAGSHRSIRTATRAARTK